jgi:hypothetical protein
VSYHVENLIWHELAAHVGEVGVDETRVEPRDEGALGRGAKVRVSETPAVEQGHGVWREAREPAVPEMAVRKTRPATPCAYFRILACILSTVGAVWSGGE